MVQGWAERLFQVGIECYMDIASHIIAAYGLKRPAYRRDVFEVLRHAGYLDADFAAQMVEMGKLRNRLVHLYWDVDPTLLGGVPAAPTGRGRPLRAVIVIY